MRALVALWESHCLWFWRLLVWDWPHCGCGSRLEGREGAAMGRESESVAVGWPQKVVLDCEKGKCNTFFMFWLHNPLLSPLWRPGGGSPGYSPRPFLGNALQPSLHACILTLQLWPWRSCLEYEPTTSGPGGLAYSVEPQDLSSVSPFFGLLSFRFGNTDKKINEMSQFWTSNLRHQRQHLYIWATQTHRLSLDFF